MVIVEVGLVPNVYLHSSDDNEEEGLSVGDEDSMESSDDDEEEYMVGFGGLGVYFNPSIQTGESDSVKSVILRFFSVVVVVYFFIMLLCLLDKRYHC